MNGTRTISSYAKVSSALRWSAPNVPLIGFIFMFKHRAECAWNVIPPYMGSVEPFDPMYLCTLPDTINTQYGGYDSCRLVKNKLITRFKIYDGTWWLVE